MDYIKFYIFMQVVLHVTIFVAIPLVYLAGKLFGRTIIGLIGVVIEHYYRRKDT